MNISFSKDFKSTSEFIEGVVEPYLSSVSENIEEDLLTS